MNSSRSGALRADQSANAQEIADFWGKPGRARINEIELLRSVVRDYHIRLEAAERRAAALNEAIRETRRLQESQAAEKMLVSVLSECLSGLLARLEFLGCELDCAFSDPAETAASRRKAQPQGKPSL